MNSERYNVSTLGQFVGQELGVSDWLTVDQERINEFADCTGDHQWIHVDVERAQRESPLGSTITHGYLTLSLLAAMQMELGIVPEGVTQALNYGLDRVRFMAPVKAGARIRTRAGIPGQLVDLRIVDDEMQDVPHDGKSSGEVVVRAPWLTQGYLNDPINSENLWRGQSGVSSQNGQCQKFVLWITWRRPVLVSSTRRSCARSTASTLRMCSINRLPVPQTGSSTKQGQQHLASALPQTKIALLKKRGKRQHHDGEEKNDEEEVGPRPDREAHHRGDVGGLYEGNHNA